MTTSLTDVTNPSIHQLVCVGINPVDPTHSGLITSYNVKSVLRLIETAENVPEFMHGGDKTNQRVVLVDGADPSKLNRELTEDIITSLDSLPRPTMIMCRSGARATAAARIYSATKFGESADSVLETAISKGEKWTESQNLKNWVSSTLVPTPDFIFRQLFDKDSSTYTYLLGDRLTGEAILIDPVDTHVNRDLQIAKDLNLKVKYGVNTHAHADHITGTALLREAIVSKNAEKGVTNAPFMSVISRSSTAKADLLVDNHEKIYFGNRFIEARYTPGHTAGCTSFVLDDKSAVFTGDALLIRGCGRTDFQGGSADTLYDSVHNEIFTLPDTCDVFPAHDYQGRIKSSVAEEKMLNPRLGGGNTKEEFVKIMSELKLAAPKLLDIAVPKNLNCGV